MVIVNRVAGGRFVSRGMGIGNSSKPHLYQTGKLHGNLTREFDQGRAELSHGRFLLDPGIFAWVEQALDTAENCSTPYSRPRIRPGRFCLGRIPGLRPGVEQVLARMGTSYWPQKCLGRDSARSWNSARRRPQLAPYGMVGPGWFEAVTCNIWLRLEYRPLDSAWSSSTQL